MRKVLHRWKMVFERGWRENEWKIWKKSTKGFSYWRASMSVSERLSRCPALSLRNTHQRQSVAKCSSDCFHSSAEHNLMQLGIREHLMAFICCYRAVAKYITTVLKETGKIVVLVSFEDGCLAGRSNSGLQFFNHSWRPKPAEVVLCFE